VEDLTRRDIKAVYLKQLQGGLNKWVCFIEVNVPGLHLVPNHCQHQAPTPRRSKVG
jgi:hypothetical protein